MESNNRKPDLSGAPPWVTPEILDDTRETWQNYFTDQLTDSDLLEIIINISRLIDALQYTVISSEANT